MSRKQRVIGDRLRAGRGRPDEAGMERSNDFRNLNTCRDTNSFARKRNPGTPSSNSVPWWRRTAVALFILLAVMSIFTSSLSASLFGKETSPLRGLVISSFPILRSHTHATQSRVIGLARRTNDVPIAIIKKYNRALRGSAEDS